ncbi:hypothetical protein [Microbacterium sp. lyk4-40-TSB-66]|uniref:hypothetical protein n=1 Tax=Microbacterium sp. lyk4-40-TSB-66 TaxID=3040294 RepID=UPI00254AD418|nr:hypothetical protein [Microbacterium sp. lyk4-40-TSB-66]
MDAFAIGDTVEITGPVMTGNVGTVVHLDTAREKYLVRVGGATQNYFPAEQLRLFRA